MKDYINTNDLGLLNGNLIIMDILGKGGYSTVYKVKDKNTNKEFAAKIIEKYCKNEIKINEILLKTQNSHFVKYISNEQGEIRLKDGSYDDCKRYLLFELASKQNLDDYISYMNGFSELHCKIIFKEILDAIYVMHKEGICHRDIKAENILLDTDEFIIKICDFGLSAFLSDTLFGCCGTEKYMAPEVFIDYEVYDGKKADIFSLGVLLFNMRTGKYLFENTKYTKNNKPSTVYDYIRLNKNEHLWKIAEANGISGLSEEFKQLFLDMVSFEPNKRPNVEDILNYEWMKEIQNLSENELKKLKIEEFKRREEKKNK